MKTRVRSKSERKRIREKTVSFIILFIVCLFWVFPMIYMLGYSFKTGNDINLHPENIFPTTWADFTWENYSGFLIRDGKVDNMPLWMLNSLWSTLVSILLTVALDLLTAYAVCFIPFKGKNFFIRFLLLWYAVPSVIGTASSLSLYYFFRHAWNITSNPAVYTYIYLWIILPSVTGIFNLLLMRNFFLSIPMDIIESARSDGASNGTIFRRIVLPLSRSTILLIVLFTFTNSWNNLQWPQLLLTSENHVAWNTITVALTGYTTGNGWNSTGVSMATSVFALIPILIVFLFTQNKMIDGLASTGVKR